MGWKVNEYLALVWLSCMLHASFYVARCCSCPLRQASAIGLMFASITTVALPALRVWRSNGFGEGSGYLVGLALLAALALYCASAQFYLIAPLPADDAWVGRCVSACTLSEVRLDGDELFGTLYDSLRCCVIR